MLEHMEDRAELGLNDWHFCVLLDVGPPLDPMGMNQRDLAGDTPLDMAYRLSRRELTGTLESLGALGDLQFRDWPDSAMSKYCTRVTSSAAVSTTVTYWVIRRCICC